MKSTTADRLLDRILRALAPAHFRNLRQMSRTRVVMASTVDEDPFPAIVAEQTPQLIRVYDLSSPLPVLRTFQPSQVRIMPSSAWSHATAAQTYSEIDLEAISDYLTWLVRTQPAKGDGSCQHAALYRCAYRATLRVDEQRP